MSTSHRSFNLGKVSAYLPLQEPSTYIVSLNVRPQAYTCTSYEESIILLQGWLIFHLWITSGVHPDGLLARDHAGDLAWGKNPTALAYQNVLFGGLRLLLLTCRMSASDVMKLPAPARQSIRITVSGFLGRALFVTLYKFVDYPGAQPFYQVRENISSRDSELDRKPIGCVLSLR